MMSRHFRLRSDHSGAIAKRLPHAKNQLSTPGSFFKQFITDIYVYILSIKTGLVYTRVYIYIYIYIQARCSAGGHFVSAGGALWVPGVTLIDYNGDNILNTSVLLL